MPDADRRAGRRVVPPEPLLRRAVRGVRGAGERVQVLRGAPVLQEHRLARAGAEQQPIAEQAAVRFSGQLPDHRGQGEQQGQPVPRRAPPVDPCMPTMKTVTGTVPSAATLPTRIVSGRPSPTVHCGFRTV